MVLSNSCMLWASEVWITCWSTVITFDPTGAVPLMLVPVTVTSSTAAVGGDAGCANAGEAKKDVAATRAGQDPPTKSCCRKPSMLPSLYFAAFSPCGYKNAKLNGAWFAKMGTGGNRTWRDQYLHRYSQAPRTLALDRKRERAAPIWR